MKNRWRNALGIALSVGFLAWTLHNVELRSVEEHLRKSNLLLFLATAVAGTLIFPLRARRWRTILDPVALHLPLGMLWRATAIGMMVNNVVPARAGEVARAYALTRETRRISFSAAFASLAVDRMFDAFVVLALMLLALLDPAFPRAMRIAGQPVTTWIGSGAVFLGAVAVVLYAIVFFPQRAITLYEMFARRVAPRFEQRGREVLLAFASGLSVLRHPGRFAAVLGWTVAHWLLNAFAFWLGFKAVGITAPFSAALLLQGLIAIGVAAPSAPGFFGIFEYLGQQGLRLYGVDPALATSWAIGFHILTFIPITLIGIYYVGRLGLHLSELRQSPPADNGGEAAPAPTASLASPRDEREG
ncbi:MAG: flippase-like domain-containing protein [Gemmatimonadaceae bacterium]|nr:flippase-like domain-containing protein [Gemmatimonadaceae bacterium]